MFCKHCGASLGEDAKFCSACGNAISIQQENIENGVVIAQPNAEENATEAPAFDEKQKSSEALTVMILGIVSAGLSVLNGSCIPGIVVGAIGLNKAKDFIKRYGEGNQKVSLGHCLSKVGLIVGIITPIVIIALYLFLFIFYLAMIVIGMSGGF